MFIKNSEYGYQLSAIPKDQNGNKMKYQNGNDVYCNMKVYFAKGSEPKLEELNKYGSYGGELIFKDDNNRYRRAGLMPYAYVDKNTNEIKTGFSLYLGEWQFDVEKVNDKTQPQVNKDVQKQEQEEKQRQIDLSPDNLPFY